MMKFTDVIATLFNKLSILEYIGKKKDTNIFVKEQTGKKTFLADWSLIINHKRTNHGTIE